MDPKARMKHVERFRRYKPILEDKFNKTKSNGRKLSDRKPNRRADFESAFGRQKGKAKQEIVYLPRSQHPGKDIV